MVSIIFCSMFPFNVLFSIRTTVLFHHFMFVRIVEFSIQCYYKPFYQNLFFIFFKQKCWTLPKPILLLLCRLLQRNKWLRRRGMHLCLSSNWWSRGLFLYWTSATTLLRAAQSTIFSSTRVARAWSLGPTICTHFWSRSSTQCCRRLILTLTRGRSSSGEFKSRFPLTCSPSTWAFKGD